jgi:hypothetical protein
MGHSLFPSDEALPTWLHTTLLILVVSPFSVPLLWSGAQAIATRHMELMSGPEFGQYFFGPLPLQGRAAVLAGFSLVIFGCTFAAMALQFSRLAPGNVTLRFLPWVLLAASLAVSFAVQPLG